MLFGAFAFLLSRTPWFESRYGDENVTVFCRCAVIVASWKETSNFLVPGANSPVQGV